MRTARTSYVASTSSDAVAVFGRDPETGVLTQKPGTAGCISPTGTGEACQDGTALDGAASVTPSPDGDSVYVVSAGSDAVAIFDRDPVTGALAQKRGTQRCVSQDGSGGTCQDGTALDGATDVTASLDGRSVYVASNASDAVATFDRDPATGALTQMPGTAGCISETGAGGCRDGTGLDLANGVATSHDGQSVYVASAASSALAVFDRDPATGGAVAEAGHRRLHLPDGYRRGVPGRHRARRRRERHTEPGRQQRVCQRDPLPRRGGSRPGNDAVHAAVVSAASAAATTGAGGERAEALAEKLLARRRKVGRRCVKPTKKSKRRQACTRKVTLTIRYTLNTATTVAFRITGTLPVEDPRPPEPAAFLCRCPTVSSHANRVSRHVQDRPLTRCRAAQTAPTRKPRRPAASGERRACGAAERRCPFHETPGASKT